MVSPRGSWCENERKGARGISVRGREKDQDSLSGNNHSCSRPSHLGRYARYSLHIDVKYLTIIKNTVTQQRRNNYRGEWCTSIYHGTRTKGNHILTPRTHTLARGEKKAEIPWSHSGINQLLNPFPGHEGKPLSYRFAPFTPSLKICSPLGLRPPDTNAYTLHKLKSHAFLSYNNPVNG